MYTAGFSAIELRCCGFNAGDLKDGGFTIQEISACGFSHKRLRNASFTVADLREGLTCAKEDFRVAGFPAAEVKVCK
jgi:intracellular multiplication protein IcmE